MLNFLDKPPKGTDSFLWTDFAELHALIHPDQCFSRGDLVGIENRCNDVGQRFDSEKRWREMSDFSGIRQKEFNMESYPFKISDDKDTIYLDLDTNNPAQKFYIGLLIASSMRYIKSKRQGEIARIFEQICFTLFSCLMPFGSEIRATWANGGPEAPYRGTLYQKMVEIAKDIRCTANFKQRDFKDNDRGDGGIDLISWHCMSDSREGMPIAFAQCGCSKDDWRFKQLEASWAKHLRHLPVMHPWATYYFLPLDLRESDGDWAYKSDIGQAIIVDRLRLLRLASQYKLLDQLPAMPFIDEVKAFRYS